MPSTTHVAVALLVVLAGCSAVPSGGGSTPTGPPDHRLGFLATGDDAYNATVTVTKAGTTVLERRLSFSGDGPRYVSLTTLNASGNYTVRVATDLPAVGGGHMNANHTVTVDPGRETTVVHTNFQDVEFVTGLTGATDLDVPIRYGWRFPEAGELSYTVYRGDTAVANRTVTVSGTDHELASKDSISTAGVYWVAATTNRTRAVTYAVGTVNASTRGVVVTTEFDGSAKVTFQTRTDGGFAARPPAAALAA